MQNDSSQSAVSGLSVSVVIPAYKRSDMLRKAVLSVIAQDMPSQNYEIIVVDSSPDDCNERVVDALRNETRGVPLTLYRKNPEGPGPSRMLGASRAKGEIVAFLDSDCQAENGWLAAGLEKFREEGVGIVQGRTLPEPGQPLGIFCRYVRIEAENPRYEGANIFYSRASLADAGDAKRDMTPNDERPTGGEDTLMAWRVKRKGWRSVFAADALVYHEVIPISVWRWFYEKRWVMLPWLSREVPEMRDEFLWGIFLDRAHASLVLLLVCIMLSSFSMFWLIGCLPYLAIRNSEPSQALRGPLRMTRAFIYLPRDLLAFGLLLLGSLRYRSLLL